MFDPSKVMAADIHAMREFTDLVCDVGAGMALMAIGGLLLAQRSIGKFDVPVLIARRELACMCISIAAVRLLDVFARASLWFDVIAAGLRMSMAAIIAIVALHAWQRFAQLNPKAKPGGE